MTAEERVTRHLHQVWEEMDKAPCTLRVGVEGLAAAVAKLARQTVLGRMRRHLAGKVTRSLEIAAASWKGPLLEKGSGLH